MVAALGGPSDFLERHGDHLPRAAIRIDVDAAETGFVSAIEARAIGLAVVELGGGRANPSDSVDHAVGVTQLLPVGAEVSRGDPLAQIHAADEAAARQAAARIRSAYTLGETKPRTPKTVLRRVAATS
jgi:thymidine phosphorylase